MAQPHPSQPRDAFGGTWIDEPDALDQLARRSYDDELRADLEQFIRTGVVIFRNAVAPEVIDRVVADTQRVHTDPARYVLKEKGKYIDPATVPELGIGHRVVDLYAVSSAARDAIYPERAARFLREIFGEPALAIQSISFEYGSQQAIHQDTAYVISERPLSLAATWLALEDITPGTGELIYYPGGHRFDHYLFSNEFKGWTPKRDGEEAHRAFLAQLHEQAKARGIALQRFHAKKGDILVWHADLPHGGSKLQREGTRRSLVTHFVPQSVKANYQHVVGDKYFELQHPSGHGFSARHYDLRNIDAEGRAALLYDGGITMRGGKQINGGGVVAHPESIDGIDGRAPMGAGARGLLNRVFGR